MIRILLISVVLGLIAGVAIAEICIPSGSGYIRNKRPRTGYTPSYHPATDPKCTPFERTTVSDAQRAVLCFMCHPHAYMGWMRPHYLRQKFIMEG